MRRPVPLPLAVLAALGLAAACTAPATPGSSSSPTVAVATPAGTPADVVTGLDVPWSVAFVDGTALISTRDRGEVLELTDGGTRVVGSTAGPTAGCGTWPSHPTARSGSSLATPTAVAARAPGTTGCCGCA